MINRISKIQSFVVLAMCCMIMSAMCNCSDDNDYGQMPGELQSFVSRYFPNSSVKSFSFADNTYHVVIANDVALTFDARFRWTAIDGRGSTLPQMLLYDQLPEKLYDFLEIGNNIAGVYSLQRNSSIITVGLIDSTLVYDISSGEITH